jgi:hypothetical protein
MMMFNWYNALWAVSFLGFPSLALAAIACFCDDHPVLATLCAILALVLVGVIAGLPEEALACMECLT